MYRLAERRDPGCATAEGSGQAGWRSHRPRAEKGPFRTETAAVNQKFPYCFQDVSMAKKKINDDTLLQLIREWKQHGWDGNSPAEAARPLGVGRAAVSKRLKALNNKWVTPLFSSHRGCRNRTNDTNLRSRWCRRMTKKVRVASNLAIAGPFRSGAAVARTTPAQ